jgi:hypothetical protein
MDGNSYLLPLTLLSIGCALIGAMFAIWPAAWIGYVRGLQRSREIEEQVDGPVQWSKIRAVRRELKGWMV